MGSRLDAILIVGLLSILSSSTTRLAFGLSEASNCLGQLRPPSGSTTKPQVTWRLDNVSTGVANFVVSRNAAYSGTLKYVSLAFASSKQMPSTNLIVDCYEKSSGPQIATSRNINYTNLPDGRLSSRIFSTSARRVDTSLSCSFSAKMQPDANFIFIVTGTMSGGLKNKHAEKYIFASSEMQCLLEAADPIVTPSTARTDRSTAAESTTVTKASNPSWVPPTAVSDFSPFGAVARTTSGTLLPAGTTTQHDSLSAQLSSRQQPSPQPEVTVSSSSLRSTAPPTTVKTLTSTTTPLIADTIEPDYSATPEQFDPLHASNNERAPSTNAATSRRPGSSAKEATSPSGNWQKYVPSTTIARLPDAGLTRNSSLPDSAAPGVKNELAKGTASFVRDRTLRLLCMAACLCGAIMRRFACGETFPAMRNIREMLA